MDRRTVSTQTEVAAALRSRPKEGRADYAVPSHPNLTLRVSPTAASWRVRKMARGKRLLQVVGRAPAMRLEEAIAAAVAFERELATSKTSIRTRGVTLRDFIAKQWKRERASRLSELRARRDTMLLTTNGGLLLDLALVDIDGSAIAEWRDGLLARGLTGGSVNRYTGLLAACLRVAHEQNAIEVVPSMGRKLREALPRDVSLSREQLDALYEAATRSPARHMHAMIVLAGEAGFRRGELFAAQWRDVDVEGASWRVRKEINKTKRERVVPLNVRAMAVLRSWREWLLAAGQPVEGDALVFPDTRHDPPRAFYTISTSWGFIVKKAKLTETGAVFHDLRHTCATLMASRGVHPAAIAALLGHAPGSAITGRYVSGNALDLRAAVEG